MSNVLIIGKKPPPIGGVTIHTSRLMDYLDYEKFEYTFYDIQDFNFFSLLFSISKAQKAHIHISNPFFILLFTILCRFLNTYSIVTIHGNLYSYGSIMSFFESLAVRFSSKVILLNNRSYEIAIKLNSDAILMSSFIPPFKDDFLDKSFIDKIKKVKKNSKKVFCTNAYSLAYDKNGNEIYGISELVEYFTINNHLALVISDPKTEYFNYFLNKEIIISENILFLTGNHPFVEVIKETDCVIRNTTTDGDSLSVKEALYFGKKVIATNCVNRPDEVVTYGYNTNITLKDAINSIVNDKIQTSIYKPENGAINLLKLYMNSNFE